MDNKTDLNKLCTLLYGIYAASIPLQFIEQTMILGFAAMMAGILVVYLKKNAAEGTPQQTHFQWLLRTFWIGNGVFLPIAIIAASILILLYTDMSPIMNAASSQDPAAALGAYNSYFSLNFSKIMWLTTVSMVPTAVWWLHRCWVGYAALKADKPVDDVMRWV